MGLLFARLIGIVFEIEILEDFAGFFDKDLLIVNIGQKRPKPLAGLGFDIAPEEVDDSLDQAGGIIAGEDFPGNLTQHGTNPNLRRFALTPDPRFVEVIDQGRFKVFAHAAHGIGADGLKTGLLKRIKGFSRFIIAWSRAVMQGRIMMGVSDRQTIGHASENFNLTGI